MDHINALFELAGALFLIPSLVSAFRGRVVQGVHWLTPMFFWSWGMWNVFYYPSLDQWMSFCAGIVLALANTVWLYAVFKFSPSKPESRQ